MALRKKAQDAAAGTVDMTPEDWRGLVGGLLKFLAEEAEEPEHAGDDTGDIECELEGLPAKNTRQPGATDSKT